MRIISKARLREFWGTSAYEDSEGPLRAWHTHVSHRSVAWHTWGDVKAEFGAASFVGNCVVFNCVVFNIGGNKYRLVTRILYRSQKVFVLMVMTHAEYDEDKWKEDCGCLEPPPSKPMKKTKTSPAKRKNRGA
jgi:mRNA interferase HigB